MLQTEIRWLCRVSIAGRRIILDGKGADDRADLFQEGFIPGVAEEGEEPDGTAGGNKPLSGIEVVLSPAGFPDQFPVGQGKDAAFGGGGFDRDHFQLVLDRGLQYRPALLFPHLLRVEPAFRHLEGVEHQLKLVAAFRPVDKYRAAQPRLEALPPTLRGEEGDQDLGE